MSVESGSEAIHHFVTESGLYQDQRDNLKAGSQFDGGRWIFEITLNGVKVGSVDQNGEVTVCVGTNR